MSVSDCKTAVNAPEVTYKEEVGLCRGKNDEYPAGANGGNTTYTKDECQKICTENYGCLGFDMGSTSTSCFLWGEDMCTAPPTDFIPDEGKPGIPLEGDGTADTKCFLKERKIPD